MGIILIQNGELSTQTVGERLYGLEAHDVIQVRCVDPRFRLHATEQASGFAHWCIQKVGFRCCGTSIKFHRIQILLELYFFILFASFLFIDTAHSIGSSF